jgi:hypothetical protein
MKNKFLTIALITFFTSCNLFSQNLSPKIKAFEVGEILEYDVFYSWGLIWVDAGYVKFSVKEEIVNDKTLFHFVGEGNSKKNWDWFFKVRDKYESYNDTTTLRPFKYIRNTNDGGDWVYNDVTFDFKNNRAIGFIKTKKKPVLKTDTLKITSFTFDPMSMIYYARAIDFENFKPKDEIPISIMLDNEVYARKIIYLGKEIIKTNLGTFKCIKFKPTLIPGTIFKEGDAMTVWVTDDENRLPIQVETPIVIGTVKVYLKKATGVKSAMSSKVEVKKK